MASAGECTVCLESFPEDRIVELTNDKVCHDCVRHIFKRALDNEADYPPRWGARRLSAHGAFERGILLADFLQDYRAKEREYKCPVPLRVFCPWPLENGTGEICNGFVGRKLRTEEDIRSRGGHKRALCRQCRGPCCLACGVRMNEMTIFHVCQHLEGDDDDDDDEQNAAFEGLQQGKDFQKCPGERCRRIIELRTGCNHVKCWCGMEFCFICGQPASDNSGHWTATCPRYNQPGADNARYDQPDD